MHEPLKNSDGTLKRFLRHPSNQVRRPTRPSQEASAPESHPAVAPDSLPLLVEETNLDASHDETHRANIAPDAVSPLSEQHECFQPHPDEETQYDLFVRRELLMLDRCLAECTLYREGRCSVTSDG